MSIIAVHSGPTLIRSRIALLSSSKTLPATTLLLQLTLIKSAVNKYTSRSVVPVPMHTAEAALALLEAVAPQDVVAATIDQIVKAVAPIPKTVIDPEAKVVEVSPRMLAVEAKAMRFLRVAARPKPLDTITNHLSYRKYHYGVRCLKDSISNIHDQFSRPDTPMQTSSGVSTLF